MRTSFINFQMSAFLRTAGVLDLGLGVVVGILVGVAATVAPVVVAVLDCVDCGVVGGTGAVDVDVDVTPILGVVVVGAVFLLGIVAVGAGFGLGGTTGGGGLDLGFAGGGGWVCGVGGANG